MIYKIYLLKKHIVRANLHLCPGLHAAAKFAIFRVLAGNRKACCGFSQSGKIPGKRLDIFPG